MSSLLVQFNVWKHFFSICFRIHNKFIYKWKYIKSMNLPSILLPSLKASFPWLAFPFSLSQTFLWFGWFAFFPINAWLLLIVRRNASISPLTFRFRPEIPHIIFYSLIRRFQSYWILIWPVSTMLLMIMKISNLI